MCAALRHRGPDDEGTYLAPTGDVALGARRLSIIDLEDGHQPRPNEERTVWVAFNGEIYNHPAIGERLRGRGHALQGLSDTEILPHLYEDYGEDLVHIVEGMFALAVWDTRRERLLLARDRFGEKPLFYVQRGRDLIFASELTALVEGLGSKPDIDPAALDAFFVLGYVPGTGSILEGVRQLPPGHLLTWDRASGVATERRYWSPPAPVTELKESPRELAAEAGRLLERSIRGRLIADVPLGVFLSGGVDSTVIAAIAARQSTKPLKTFTIGYEGSSGSHDERAASREMAMLIGSDHRDIAMSTEEAAARVPALLSTLDQPLADSAVVPLHSVAEFARSEVTVAIGGEGADELFGGYPRYSWLGRAPQSPDRNGSLSALLGGMVPRAKSTSPRFLRAFDLVIPRPIPERHLDWVTAGRRHERTVLYGQRLLGALSEDRVLAALERDFAESRSYSVPGSLMRLDQLNWLPDDVLVKADRASMLASLELRTPYLQRELAEFATSVAPSTHLARGGKQLLRLLLSDLLPGAPRRRKAAFLPPIDEWLRGPLGALMETQIARGSLYSQGWIRPNVASRLLHEHRRGEADRSPVLWPLLAAGLWLDRFHGVEELA
jgi:asparagine synthase (glutamine-hydrolysing)